MANDHPINPTPGAKTYQSAGMAAGFRSREGHKAAERGDYSGMMNRSETDYRAQRLARTKLGGRMGGSTFERDEILIREEPKKEMNAGPNAVRPAD